MSAWRREALQCIPACRGLIEVAGSVEELWRELYFEFAAAYGHAIVMGSVVSHTIEDEAVIRGIYEYAAWCLFDSRTVEARTGAVLSFYENLGINLYARDEIPLYMTPEVFTALHDGGLLHYFLCPEEYNAFVETYWKQRG